LPISKKEKLPKFEALIHPMRRIDMGFTTPVLFIVFNRPETTVRVFEQIRLVKPRYLFVAADGPRKNSPADVKNCELVRELINKSIDWDCEVKKLYRDQNLGCRLAVSSAVTWFFDNVEEGIILEDDCLPHSDFFSFSKTLLEKYRNESSVMHISGDNFQFGVNRGNTSYYFSRISHIWGWASWRRAWKAYDVNMTDYPAFLQSDKPFFLNKRLEKYWHFHFKRMYKGADTWDYQWTYAIMKKQGYCIIPNVNLISNIGFGDQATHSFDKKDLLSRMDTYSIGELIHPDSLQFNDEADEITIQKVFPIPSFRSRAINKIKKKIKSATK